MAARQVICDTDVMIDYLDSKHVRHIKTKETIENNIGIDNIVLGGITQIELLLGALNKRDQLEIKRSISRFTVIYINEDINLKARSLIETYALSHGLALPDSFIAATSIASDLQLFTYNVKDYKFIRDLTLFKA
jgi:predicted nucleic acid-binding protein